MKKIFLFIACCAVALLSVAQKESFDLATYNAPTTWKKEKSADAIQFSKEDAATGAYCLITLYKAVPGTTNHKENFDLAWESLVKEMVKVSAAPEMQAPTSENGWETHSGYAPFESDGNKGVVMLVTASAVEKMVNLIVLTNTDVYENDMLAFFESISLKKQEANATLTPIADEDNAQHSVENSIIGAWSKSGSVNPDYNDAYATSIAGYSTDQYIFNSNGTYHFISKTFGMSFPKIILVKENGAYLITGNKITITPQKSVIEAWSKKDGVDKWGKLLTTQNRTLEKVTYQFTKHYFSGIQQWNLVLQCGKTTQRDGPFSTNTTFTNAWYYSPISANNTAIELPGGHAVSMEEIKKKHNNKQ
ncbi:MAG TPA: hypothetical protein PK275_06320 [Chitinophagaceae bacterium]|jgi:hypothetical protein|nr:hypothetical protein [Chitinophagaceae bacterium]